MPFTPRPCMEVYVPDVNVGKGEAGDAKVFTGLGPNADRVAEYLRTLADEAEDAVSKIENMLEGMKESLATKKAELKKFRAEADTAAKGDKPQ